MMVTAAPTVVHWTRERRVAGLRRFAFAITVLNVFGHTMLGFEQPWIVPFLVLLTAYGLELAIEAVDAWSCERTPRFRGGIVAFVDFLLPAHISALAVGMLIYANERLWVVAFAAAVAVASKALVRVRLGPVAHDGLPVTRHVFNPSNFAITIVLLLFPWVGGAPPYQYVENVTRSWQIALPLIVFVTGSVVNTRFTGRIPLAAAWVGAFIAQALVRSAVNGTPLEAGLAPVTGVAFVLYTFYMVTDPGTTPESPRAQVAFGAGVAIVYGLLVQAHVVFGFYYALTVVTGIRGLWLASRQWVGTRIDMPDATRSAPSGVPGPAVARSAGAWLFEATPWEHRWRALPMFGSQGVAVVANAWLTGSFAMPTSPLAIVSVALAVTGLGLRVWGVGQISAATMVSMSISTDRLVTSGVYGLVRHPLYLGDLLIFAGYALFLPAPLGVAFMVFHLVRTWRLMAYEERQMRQRHGAEYERYASAVPALWPRLAAPSPAHVHWAEGLAASAIWIGLAIGYVAVWRAGDVWAITPYETAGFLFAAVYFSRGRRVTGSLPSAERSKGPA
jgi:protein-S-isoprenylcysteine O-methyltransferase Ste14